MLSKSAGKAYAIIKAAVLNGDFNAGDRLKEERLVEMCGVSRTPVRDAIKSLTAENYLVIKPNHGAHVANWSKSEIDDIFKLRALNEGFAARRAAELITPEQLDLLKEQHQIVEDMLASDNGIDVTVFLQTNRIFHQTIIAATQSEIIKQAVNKLVSPPMVYQTAQIYSADDLMRSNAHHLELIEALSARNGDWSEAVMHTHILAANRRFNEMAQQ